MAEYYIGFWNVENLFDTVNSTERPDWLQSKLKSELKGWTVPILKKKIACLAEIIAKMNNGQGPDILGVCEVENKTVVDKLLAAISLPGRNYAVEHHDMSDKRGIDVAFIYDQNLFKATAQFSHTILKREATRDLFQVNFETVGANAKQLVLIGNHWPSRSGQGQYDSEPYRILAAETLSYYHKRIREILGKDVAIMAMGDFNDEPYDRSLQNYALATRMRSKVTRGSNPWFFNLMWPLMGDRKGTHFFDGQYGMLDQLLVNKALLTGSGAFKVLPDTTAIEDFAEMSSTGTNPEPVRFGRPFRKGKPNKDFTGHGYSDHYPVSVRIRTT